MIPQATPHLLKPPNLKEYEMHDINLDNEIIDESRKAEESVAYLKSVNKKIAVYGAGVYSYVIANYLKSQGIDNIIHFVDDQFLEDTHFIDETCYSYSEIIDHKEDYNIVIGFTNYDWALEKLQKSGVNDPIIIDVPDFINNPDPFFTSDYIFQNHEQFVHVLNFFEDDLSRRSYCANLNARLNQDAKYIKEFVRVDHLYFSNKEFFINNNGTLVDVGSYNGDSITDSINTDNIFSKYLCLEPNKRLHHDILNVATKHNVSDRTEVIGYAAWHEETALCIDLTDKEIDSKVTGRQNSNESLIVTTTTIDQITRNQVEPVTMIKLDINGAEYEALRGAEETIKKQRPFIAVKLHTKENLWRIPMLLKRINPNIKLYIRQRNYMSMMLVLYAQ